MRPLIMVLIALNVAVWGGLFAFERVMANSFTVTSTATISTHDAQSLGR